VYDIVHVIFLRHCTCFISQGGPLYKVLHDVLGAYVCYRPDVGYVSMFC